MAALILDRTDFSEHKIGTITYYTSDDEGYYNCNLLTDGSFEKNTYQTNGYLTSTRKIPVIPGSSIQFNVPDTPGFEEKASNYIKIGEYDINKNWISRQHSNYDNNNVLFSLSPGTYYIIVCIQYINASNPIEKLKEKFSGTTIRGTVNDNLYGWFTPYEYSDYNDET